MGERVLKSRFHPILANAAADVANLTVLGLCAGAALVFGSWWLLLFGIAVYMGLIVLKASSPAFARRVLGAAWDLPCLPEPSQINDPGLQTLVSAIATGRAKVERVLLQTPDEVKRCLVVVLSSLDELERCAARLVMRAEVLAQYLRANSRDNVEDEIRQLCIMVQRSIDPAARSEYESALLWRREQLHALEDVTRAQERMTASLLRVIAIIEGLPARIMRMRILDAEVKETLSEDLGEAIDRMQCELQTSEQTLRGLAVFSDEPCSLKDSRLSGTPSLSGSR